jgi:hypothetical protein
MFTVYRTCSFDIQRATLFCSAQIARGRHDVDGGTHKAAAAHPELPLMAAEAAAAMRCFQRLAAV